MMPNTGLLKHFDGQIRRRYLLTNIIKRRNVITVIRCIEIFLLALI